jgi:hypothetical protein
VTSTTSAAKLADCGVRSPKRDSRRLFDLESVFVDAVGVEVAFGIFTVTAASAVERLIAGVVERSLAGIDSRLAIRLGAFRRIPDGYPLGIAFEPASHNWFLLRRSCGRACSVLLAGYGYRDFKRAHGFASLEK